MADSWVRQPHDSGANINIVFGGDFGYTLSRGMFLSEERGLPNGEGVLVSGGYSIGKISVVEGLITDEEITADEILWKEFDELLAQYTSSKQVSRIRLYLIDTGGFVEADGWVTNYAATRDALDGHAAIKVTFDFLIKSKNTSSLN